MTAHPTPTSEVLNLAADLIEERGWVGPFDAPTDFWGGGAATDQPVCIEGGIMAAVGLEVVPGDDATLRAVALIEAARESTLVAPLPAADGAS